MRRTSGRSRTIACQGKLGGLHVAGVDHLAFFLRLERDGEDLPGAEQIVDEGRVRERNRVRYELLRHFGSFITE